MPGAILNVSPYETGSCVQAQFTPVATEMATWNFKSENSSRLGIPAMDKT